MYVIINARNWYLSDITGAANGLVNLAETGRRPALDSSAISSGNAAWFERLKTEMKDQKYMIKNHPLAGIGRS